MKRLEKKERRGLVREEFRHHPSFTDEELAVKLAVSVATIRLDRQQLGIPQLRDRMEQAVQKVAEFPSDLRSDVKILDITPGEKGIYVPINHRSNMTKERIKKQINPKDMKMFLIFMKK